MKPRQIDSLPEYLLRDNYFQVSDRHGKSQDSFYACWGAVKTSSCVVSHSLRHRGYLSHAQHTIYGAARTVLPTTTNAYYRGFSHTLLELL